MISKATAIQSKVRDIASKIIGMRPHHSDRRTYGRRFKWYRDYTLIEAHEADAKIINIVEEYNAMVSKMTEALSVIPVTVRIEVQKKVRCVGSICIVINIYDILPPLTKGSN